jgi:hypothetical protein
MPEQLKTGDAFPEYIVQTVGGREFLTRACASADADLFNDVRMQVSASR